MFGSKFDNSWLSEFYNPSRSVPFVPYPLASVMLSKRQRSISVVLRILTRPCPPFLLLFEGGLLHAKVTLIIISNNLNY